MIGFFGKRNTLVRVLADLGVEPLFQGGTRGFRGDPSILEDAVGHSLPQDYRSFLSRYPTSVFGLTVGVDALYEPKMEYPVGIIYGLDDCEYQVLSMLSRFSDHLPSSLLPIAEGAPGDQIVLGLFGPAEGCVYYWDHEGPPLSQLNGEGLTLLAESFLEFVKRCHPTREEPDQRDEPRPIHTWYADDL